MVRIGTADGGQFLFSASDKSDMLQWIEAIDTASRLEPSTLLLHSGGGVVVQTGFLDCQEFALEVGGASPLQSPPPLNRRLGSGTDFSGTYSAVDYGKHWTVLKSSGLIQCLVRRRPETLFSLTEAKKVTIHNPRDRQEGAHYYISLHDEASRIVLQAECPSDHFDWVLAIERVLQEKGLQDLLTGDRGNQSGYVTLKALMMMQESGKLGDRRSSMQLYAMPRSINILDDVYEPPEENLTPERPPPLARKRSDVIYENQTPPTPPLPPTYENFVPPPPLPPRGAGAPPLPPKGISRSVSSGSPGESISPTLDGDYIIMHPHSLPPTPSGPAPLASPPRSVPTTPNGPHHTPTRGKFLPPSQPITIPNRRPGKQSKLLRSDSAVSSSSSQQTLDSSFPEGQEWVPSPSSSHSRQLSGSRSLPRRSASSTNFHSSSLQRRQASAGGDSEVSPAVPANLGDGSSGYNSPLLGMSPSPGMRRSQSNQYVRNIKKMVPSPRLDDVSRSDGMVVGEVKVHHPISQAGSVSLSERSDGYGSTHSSTDDMVQVCV